MTTKFNEIGEFGEPWFRGSSHGSVVCVAKIRQVGWKPVRWSAETYAYTTDLEYGGELVAESIPSREIQGRIVDCVNAMRGISNPGRFMHELISCAHARTTAEVESAIETLRQMLADVVTIQPVEQIELEDARGDDDAVQAAVDAERAFLIGRCNIVSAAAAKEPAPNAIDCIGTILGIIRARISHPAPQGDA